MKTVRFLMIALIMFAATSAVSAQKKVDPTGTWTFNAPNAPYEYNSGDFVIDKDGKEFTAKLVFGESYEIKGSSVKYEDNVLSFKIYIEGETINLKGTVSKESIKGTASYSEGTIDYTAKKKKK